MRFSQRHGHKEVKTTIQQDDVDNELRTDIWNTILIVFQPEHSRVSYSKDSQLCVALWVSHFRMPLDKIPYHVGDFERGPLREAVFDVPWFEVYDLVEFLSEQFDSSRADAFERSINEDLERNLSGYRLISRKIVPIASEVELSTIAEVIEQSDKFAPARRHVEQALRLLSDRKNPDYSNSVKESISAVESVCRILTGKKTLSAALKTLEGSGLELHSALTLGWEKIYGYTSDTQGIRHGSIDLSEVDQDTAKYFVVSCSAFVNFLIAQSAKAQQ